MENNIKNIILLTSTLLFQFIFAQDWELIMTAQDVAADGSEDYIRIGYCDGCHDGFHFGEDEYDLPNGGNIYTDIQIFNYDWLGDQDDHIPPVTCNNPNFYVDKRSLHEPEYLSEWLISGSTYSLTQNTPIQLSWSIENLIDDIDIFLYIGDTGYNMKDQSSLIVDSSELYTEFDFDTFTETVNIKILSGGCASVGTTAYYIDEDGDGMGCGSSQQYCPGYQPDGWVDNGDDEGECACPTNNTDECDVCDGGNGDDLGCGCFEPAPSGCDNTCGSTLENDDCGVCNGDNADIDNCGVCFGDNADMDNCGVCFGSNEDMDDCGECNGFNQSCINDFFEEGPQDLIAFINDEVIDLSWDQLNYPTESRILGFNIYLQNIDMEYITNTSHEFFTINNHNEGIFCVAAYDRFNNESSYTCSEASEMVTINFTLHDGPNLISYSALPSDVGLDNIFASIEDDIYGVVTEGQSAVRISNLGLWVGSLTEIIPTKGYWVILDLDDVFAEVNYEVLGFPIDFNIQYQLEEGANLISYIGNDSVPLNTALPDDVEPYVTDIIAEGNAAYNHPLAGWLGSLMTFNIGKGYWVKVSQNLTLQWELEASTSSFGRVTLPEESSTFNFNQSSQQAFYYISEINGFTPTNIDDKIISYCHGNITGSRNWNGIYTDIPAMGDDGNNYSEGYCEIGDKPEFKFYDAGNDMLISLESNNVSPWASNGITFMTLSAESMDVNLPTSTLIHGAYPNPFNPISTIEYSLGDDSYIELSIHNVNGEIVETLFSGYKIAGAHQMIWNAENYPSGMYFFTLNSSMGNHTHKLLLLK